MNEFTKSDKALNIILDFRANELFGKPYLLLTYQEQYTLNRYIRDGLNPMWKRIYGDDGTISEYEVSNMGCIRNANSMNICKPMINKKNGYVYIHFSDRSVRLVHRIVAKAFIPNLENKAEVNHINGNKHCNWVGNLEWTTRQENATHAVVNNLILRGSNQPVAIHTEEEAHKVCKLIEQGKGAAAIARETGLPKSFVIGILYRGEWSEVSSQYKIPKPKSFMTEELVHTICKKLESGVKAMDIAKELNLNPNNIYSITTGAAWRRISNQYNIPGLEKSGPIERKLSDKIYDIFKSDITDTNEVIAKLGIEPTKSNKKYVRRLRVRYLADQAAK